MNKFIHRLSSRNGLNVTRNVTVSARRWQSTAAVPVCRSCRLRLSQQNLSCASLVIARQASSSTKRQAPSTATASSGPSQVAPPLPTKETVAHSHYDWFPMTLASGPPPAGPFDIDVRELRQEFLRLQNAVHPDKHSGSEKLRAETLSARLNEAYKTLCSPLARSQYLLSLRGIDVGDEKAKIDDTSLLMEVMEMREAIDDAQSEEELEGVKNAVLEREQNSVQILREAFQKDDLECAKTETIRLRYWLNVLESIRGWTKEFGGGVLVH